MPSMADMMHPHTVPLIDLLSGAYSMMLSLNTKTSAAAAAAADDYLSHDMMT